VQSLEYTPYVRREIRSLKLVDTDMESKAYKMEDRTGLNAVFAQRGDCDDVLLVKNGFLTDTSYSNIALFDGEQWFTPRVPLLYGVNRAGLLTEGKIIEKDIKTEELMNFQSLTLFNALIEFGDIILDISVINR
jgi:4-amino-4-deoxychorismate lyase